MKEALYKPPLPPDRLLVTKDLEEPYFDPYWHFHTEYQLFVVLRGNGTRFVGDDISPFETGDMVFCGPNLPHLWRCDDFYFERKEAKATRGLVVYFREDILGRTVLESREAEDVRLLLERSRRGLVVGKPLRDDVQRRLISLLHRTGFEQVLVLMDILYRLATSDDVAPIASVGYTPLLRPADTERLNRVQNYIFENYKTDLTLSEAAAIAHMSPSSFSRYFQKRTHKKFSQFVSELRIGHACKLLQKDQGSISQIAFSSGFPTLSNFNKKFRMITGKTPREYRSMYI